MSFKDSFDYITYEIEKLVEYDDNEGYLDANIIFKKISDKEGRTKRDLDVIFSYISGKTLNRYIKDRKMMATYRNMMKDKEYDVQSYQECSGYGSESAFSEAFSKRFGIPPTVAHKQKDITKIEKPLTIDSIITGADMSDSTFNKYEKVMGLPKDFVDRYNDILDYQAMFGLEDKYAELAVYMNEENGIDLYDAFSSVDHLVMDYEEISSRDSLKGLLLYVDTIVPALYVKHLYKDVNLPELNNWYFKMKDEGGNMLKETPEFTMVFIDNVSEGLTYDELKAHYNNYLEYKAECIAELTKKKIRLEQNGDFGGNGSDELSKKSMSMQINCIDRMIEELKSNTGFKDYVEKIQIYGSIESYDAYMNDIQKDFEQYSYDVSPETEERVSHLREASFWAEYDEKHINM